MSFAELPMTFIEFFSINRIQKYLFLWFLMLTPIVSAHGQNSISQLKNDLEKETPDSIKLKSYKKIFSCYQYSNPDSAIYFLKQGFTYFTSRNYKPGIASTTSLQVGIYIAQGMLDLARQKDEEALELFTELNNQVGIANSLNALGIIEGRKSNFSEAAKHFIVALKIYESLNDTDGITNGYIKLGAVNDFSGNLDKALDYYFKGLAMAKNDQVNRIYLYNNIGTIYNKKDDHERGMVYIKKALEESSDPKYAQIRILPLTNMGGIYDKLNKPDSAMAYYMKGLAIARREKMPEDVARLLVGIADLIKVKSPENALAQLNEALDTAKGLGQRNLEADILDQLIELYKTTGDYKKAFETLNAKKELLDSIFNIEKTKTIANLEAGYEKEKLNARVQHLEIAEQKQLQRRNTIIIITLILTIGLAIVIYFLRKTNQLNHHLAVRETELQKTNTVKDKLFSIIGHDLVGPIGNIPIVVGMCRDNSLAPGEMDDMLAILENNSVACFETLENLLNWGKSQMNGISINQVNFIVSQTAESELKLIQVAAGSKRVLIENLVPDDLTVYADPNHFRFILRNLLSNAVKYSRMGGRVQFRAWPSEDNAHIIFSVKDEGVGIKPEKLPAIFDSFGVSTAGTDNERGNGIGLKLCKEFVLENGGKIWAESEEGRGSIFYFSLMAAKPVSV